MYFFWHAIQKLCSKRVEGRLFSLHVHLILARKDNELSQKNRFQSVPIGALCLYNIQRENLIFKKISLYVMGGFC